MKTKENIYNIPNLLSAYRLLMFPVILLFALKKKESVFAILLCINLVTDILDGFIARTWKLETRFGAALDNLADLFTYVLAITGIFLFKQKDLGQYQWLLITFIGIVALSYLVAFARFRKIPGMHLRSCVISAYLQGLFFLLLFSWKFILPLYIFSIGFGILAYFEKIIILCIITEIKPGLKGLYWILRKNNT